MKNLTHEQLDTIREQLELISKIDSHIEANEETKALTEQDIKILREERLKASEAIRICVLQDLTKSA